MSTVLSREQLERFYFDGFLIIPVRPSSFLIAHVTHFVLHLSRRRCCCLGAVARAR